jgi:hypothetical protein
MTSEATNVRVSYRIEGAWVDALTGATTPVFAGFPNDTTVGIAQFPGWEPDVVVEDQVDGWYIDETDAVIEDVRYLNTPVIVRATNVTFRRCEFIGCILDNNYNTDLWNRMVVEDCTLKCDPPGFRPLVGHSLPSIATGGYTARRVALIDVTEGFRTGGSNYTLQDESDLLGKQVRLIDCYSRHTGPDPCTAQDGIDYHGDGLQTFDGALGGVPLVIRNCRFKSIDKRTTEQPEEEPLPLCSGTSCIISGFHQSLEADVDGFLMGGAAATFAVESGGDFRNLYFEDDDWVFTPVSVSSDGWNRIGDWSALVCTLDANGQPDLITGSIPHGYPGFGPFDPPPEP